jgi:hypothetical protein
MALAGRSRRVRTVVNTRTETTIRDRFMEFPLWTVSTPLLIASRAEWFNEDTPLPAVRRFGISDLGQKYSLRVSETDELTQVSKGVKLR